MTAIQIHECLSELRKLSLSDIEFDFLQVMVMSLNKIILRVLVSRVETETCKMVSWCSRLSRNLNMVEVSSSILDEIILVNFVESKKF